MATRRAIEGVIRELAVRQHGVATRQQLMAAGVGPHRVDGMLASGRLSCAHRGVYQTSPLPTLHGRAMAAVLAGGSGALASHGTAALVHGIPDPGIPAVPVHIVVPRSRHPRLKSVVIHRVRDLHAADSAVVDGVPITTVARTLLDLTTVITRRELEQAVAASLRLRLVTKVELRDATVAHPQHRGSPALARLVEGDGDPLFTRSKAEEKLLHLIRAARLPAPEMNVRVLGYEADFLWRQERIVAEVDGFAFHGSARAFGADRKRDADLTASGYRVLRFTWADVTRATTATAVRIAQALATSSPLV